MEKPKIGALVTDLRGYHLGRVVAINHCCVELDSGMVSAQGIFTTTAVEVELVCDADQVQRYPCPIHSGVNTAK